MKRKRCASEWEGQKCLNEFPITSSPVRSSTLSLQIAWTGFYFTHIYPYNCVSRLAHFALRPNQLFYASRWSPTVSGGKIATLSNIGFLQQKGWGAYKPSPWLLVSLSYDRLKFGVLREVGPSSNLLTYMCSGRLTLAGFALVMEVFNEVTLLSKQVTPTDLSGGGCGFSSAHFLIMSSLLPLICWRSSGLDATAAS